MVNLWWSRSMSGLSYYIYINLPWRLLPCKPRTTAWVALWTPPGCVFVVPWWCSCTQVSACWRPAPAGPRTPQTSWWRTWWMSAWAPWDGGSLVGPLPMVQSESTMVAMALLDGMESWLFESSEICVLTQRAQWKIEVYWVYWCLLSLNIVRLGMNFLQSPAVPFAVPTSWRFRWIRFLHPGQDHRHYHTCLLFCCRLPKHHVSRWLQTFGCVQD